MLQFERDGINPPLLSYTPDLTGRGGCIPSGFCPQVESILEGGVITFSQTFSYDLAALRRIFSSCDCFSEQQYTICVHALAAQVPPGTIKGSDAVSGTSGDVVPETQLR
jgi:hypothetical protein